MSVVYYIEVNLTCIVLMLLIWGQLGHRQKTYSTKNLVFNALVCSTMVLCAAEMISGIFRGQDLPTVRVLLEITNLLYYEMMAVIGFEWLLYVNLRLGWITRLDWKTTLKAASPLLCFTVTALSNPFTHFLFTIDRGNLYLRNSGTYLHWAVSLLYLILPTVQAVMSIVHEPSRLRRSDLFPLVLFALAPAVGSVIQMIFYGVSSTQVGITISIVWIFLMEQNSQVSTDSLTGLNNRRGLSKYLDACVQSRSGLELSIMMIDINNFKQINDRFGHVAGDQALIDTAEAIKNACDRSQKKIFLCRYGGDEFLIAGRELSPADVSRIEALIQEEIKSVHADQANSRGLSVEIGSASGACPNAEDAERLIREADSVMYANKGTLR
ncbi:MAG: GGDEF domain-containing protein [Oscillibacter sp.]|jgi:diguanylate cyclase (GGDEF)-like protein|nr:GGDEF domain-containing protein [Oscillibacter sp.]